MYDPLYGAVIGDIAGSAYEFHNVKRKDIPLFPFEACFTDDTAMTMAVANAFVKVGKDDIPAFENELVREMQRIGRLYPDAGYGGNFIRWIMSDKPAPYGSYGNGSAMRVSACALVAETLKEAETLAKASAEVTHNHREGIRGAKAIAAAIWLAKTHTSKKEIRSYIQKHYYPLRFTLDKIRPDYQFDVSCQGSVPQAIVAFLESEDFEDAIRNAISIGGDSDTIAAMTGSIAWMYYGWEMSERMTELCEEADKRLTDEFRLIIHDFRDKTLYPETGMPVGSCYHYSPQIRSARTGKTLRDAASFVRTEAGQNGTEYKCEKCGAVLTAHEGQSIPAIVEYLNKGGNDDGTLAEMYRGNSISETIYLSKGHFAFQGASFDDDYVPPKEIKL